MKRLTLIDWPADRDDYPYRLGLFDGGMLDLAFERPVTLLVGENGSGKSTLLEAIAEAIGFPAAGGSRDYLMESETSRPAWSKHLRLAWLPKVTNGFFFRAESFHNIAAYVDKLAERWPEMRVHYGERPLHAQSHGESFLALFEHRLGLTHRAIYLLDEPEAALSPARQLRFLKLLAAAGNRKQTQFVIATHSPILMHCPGADLWNFDGGRPRPAALADIESYCRWRDFFADPAAAIEAAIGGAGEDDS